jgi:hypothetical protein
MSFSHCDYRWCQCATKSVSNFLFSGFCQIGWAPLAHEEFAIITIIGLSRFVLVSFNRTFIHGFNVWSKMKYCERCKCYKTWFFVW